MYVYLPTYMPRQCALSNFPTLFFKDLPAYSLFARQCMTLISFICHHERFLLLLFIVMFSYNIYIECSLRFDFDFFSYFLLCFCVLAYALNIYSVRKITEMSNGMRVYCWQVTAIKTTMHVLNHTKFPKKRTHIQMRLHTR